MHIPWEGQIQAVQALSSGEVFPDQWWWWARHAHIHSVSDFFVQQKTYARETAGTAAARLYSLETVEQLCGSACQDLALVFGLGLSMEEEGGHLPGMLDLEVWLKQVTGAQVSAHVELSPLWLPQGMRTGHLHIDEQVTMGSSVRQ